MSLLSRTTLRSLVVATATLAVVPLTAGPASAARIGVEDATGDVWTISQSGEFTRAPEVKEIDFVRTTFAHTGRRVIMLAKFREIEPIGGPLSFSVRMRDQNRKKFIVNVDATARKREGRAELTTYRDERIACKVAHVINYDKNTVRASFPRHCIGNPRTLEFTAVAFRGLRGQFYVDNPHNRGSEPRGWTAKVRRG